MKTQSNGLEVKIRLQPTVREISRRPKKSTPAGQPAPKRGRFPRITQVVALALQFQEMIDSREIRGHTDLARLGCVSRERISQIMMLTWLAPDIQEEILRLPQSPGGRFHVGEAMLRPIARLPLWDDQRERWCDVIASASSGMMKGEA
ncbi:MAG: hypothetical protein IT165_22610 [Bryobacterales bacterium]|nr:hypothetical protein [Bryobacterales bacterium]